MSDQPVIYMIAGPNGAGKTTTAMRLLPEFLSINRFVNADEIARGLNPLNPAGEAMAAGRIMLQLMKELIQRQESFAFETTGASRSFVKILREAKTAGYELGLIFLWLPNYAMAQHRVELRVLQGGHHIQNNIVQRRFKRGLYNIFELYLPMVTLSEIYDNRALEPNLVAYSLKGDWMVIEPNIWQLINTMRQFNAIS